MNGRKHAWIFDIDGVLSNLQTRRVSEPTLFPSLLKILEQGDILAFNTGRSIPWIEEKIITPLREKVSDPLLLEYVFSAGEKGGTWQQEGHEEIVQEDLIAPPEFRVKIKKLLDKEFHDSILYDLPKQTMISGEMREDISMEYFQERLEQFKFIAEKYIQEAGLQDILYFAADKIAFDIEHKNAGKDVGMQHILTWLEATGRHPEHFYCFGDNPSDLHMGELLKKQDYPFTFVYVGTKPIETASFPVMIPKQPFDKGTAEALQLLQSTS